MDASAELHFDIDENSFHNNFVHEFHQLHTNAHEIVIVRFLNS